MPISPVTYKVYEAICEYMREDIHPTYREIAERANMAHTSVLRHIDKLEGMGWIVRVEYKMRNLRLGPNAPGLNPSSLEEKKKKNRRS
jgi:DNA-binding Lrp family transcriptional regulator